MKIKYGNYTHDSNEVILAISKRTNRGPTGEPYSYTETWDMDGELLGDVSSLTTKIAALQAAYASGGYDLKLLTDAGAATGHSLISANSLHGTKVVAFPSFPTGQGAEYATYRRYKIVVEAEFACSSGVTIDYQQSFHYQGTGGPEWIYQVPLTGNPIAQQLTAKSLVTVIQEGRYTISGSVYPSAPSPVDPANELTSRRLISKIVPGDNTNQRTTTWSYTFLYYAHPGY